MKKQTPKRKPNGVQVGTYLDPATLKAARELAKARDWTLSKAVAKLAARGALAVLYEDEREAAAQ